MLITISVIISVFAGILQLFGYLVYNRKILSGEIVPNAGSWLIWALGGVATTVSYIFVSDDWVKDILPVVCASSGIVIFIFCLAKGRFERIDLVDWMIISFDIAITIYWYLSKETLVANMLYMASEVTSFIPIFRYVWKNPLSEEATPWILWSVAYFLMGITVLMRYEKWEDLFYPVVLFILSMGVAVLSSDYLVTRRINRRKRLKTAIDTM